MEQTAVDTAVTIWYGSAADCWKRSFQVGDITTQNGLVEDKLKFQSGREIVEGRWHGGTVAAAASSRRCERTPTIAR